MEGARRVGARSRFVNETDRWIGSGDIDNDGLADVVFHDTAGGGLSLWRGKATGDFTASAAFGTHPGRGWTLVDVLEADGDAHADLAWHNPWAERVEVWLMQDAGRVATTTHPIAGRYRLAASGDFDGDGRGDIAWRDGARRELWLWRAAGAGPGFEMEWIADYPREATRHPGAFTGLPPGR